MSLVDSLVRLSRDSDASCVERSSGKQTPTRHNTQNVIISAELSEVHVGDMNLVMMTVVPPTSPQPNFVTMESDTKEPTIPFGCGRQDPVIPAQFELVAQPFQRFSYNGGYPTSNESEQRAGQSTITSATNVVFNLDVNDDFEYSARL